MTQLLQILCIYGTLYVASVPSSVTIFDLIAYTGYQYIGLVFALLIGLVAGDVAFFIGLAYTTACAAIVLYSALQAATTASVTGEGGRKIAMLVACGLQVVVMLWLARH